jgi:hypothetical protein
LDKSRSRPPKKAGGRCRRSGDLLVLFVVLVVLVIFVVSFFVFFFVVRFDLGQFDNGQGQGLPKQVPFLAHPNARDRVFVDFRHRDRLTTGFQNDDIAWSQVHVPLPQNG